MPSNFRSRLDAALEVPCPTPPIAAIRNVAAQRTERVTMLRSAIAALALTVAIGGFSLSIEHARSSTAVPQPVASATPAPTVT